MIGERNGYVTMKLYLRAAVLLCLFTACIGSAAYAEVESITYAPSGGKMNIVISGTSTEAEESVTVTVLKAGTAEEEFMAASEYDRFKMIEYVRETRTNADKKWSMAFVLDGDEKVRRLVHIREDKSGVIRTLQLYGRADAVVAVNAARASEMETVLEEFSPFLGYKSSDAYRNIFTAFDDARKEYVYACLESENSFKTTADIDRAFENYTAMAIVAKARGYEQLYKDFPVCAEVLGLDTREYKKLSAYKQTRVCAGLTDAFGDRRFTKSELQNKLSALVEEINKSDSGGGNGGSGGNGGGGGGTSGGAGRPVDFNAPADTSELIVPKTEIFEDLTSVEWARESIETLAQRGIINGKANKIFAPEDTVTREEFVKMTVAALDLTDADAECDFTDVDRESWYYSFVGAAVNSGVVNGIGGGLFGVGRPITREDIATVLWNGIKNKISAEEGKTFADADKISDYARTPVCMLRGAGIVDGFENNIFGPKQNATRAEAAAMLYRTLQAIE